MWTHWARFQAPYTVTVLDSVQNSPELSTILNLLRVLFSQISATLEQTVKKGQGGVLLVREIATDNDFQQICVDRG
jgi:hypothetical protein